MASEDKLNGLVQQAASIVTLAGAEDADDIGSLQKLLEEIGACVEGMSDLPGQLRQETASAAEQACDQLRQLRENRITDPEDTLHRVSDVVVALQDLTRQIEKGVAPQDLSTAFCADAEKDVTEASDEPSDSVEESQEPEPAPEEPQAAAAAEPAESDAPGQIIDADDVEMIRDFITESAEHIESAEAGLLDLENSPDDTEAINLIFRGFHTIKGMAGFLNLKDIGSLAHAAENLLDLGRKGQRELVGPTMDVIFASVDMLKNMMEALTQAVNQQKPLRPPAGLKQLLDQLHACAEGKDVEVPAAEAPEPAAEAAVSPSPAESAQTASDETETDDAPSGQGGGATVAPPTAAQPAPAARTPSAKTPPVKTPAASAPAPAEAPASTRPTEPGKPKQVADEKIKVSTERLDKLVNMVGELVIAQSMVSQEACKALAADHDLCRTVSHQGKIVRELQELSMMMRMVPIQGVFQKMARLVRDLSQKSGKKVRFSTEGEDTELDRIVVDQIGDPLVHMIRNSVDHGIESEVDRVKAGKDPVGSVQLRACHQAGSIVIEIIDDGRGLDRDKILQKATDNGILQPGQELSDQEIYKLIFHAGLSTAAKVTEVSGRGVGMDVVKKNIEALRGKIDIESELGRGTTFTIRLPLTMAIIEGQIVRVGDAHYIVPIVNIESCLRPARDQISTVRGRAEMVLVQGQLVPMYRLYQLFGVKPDCETPCEASLVVVEEDGRKGCLMVDELLGQHQVVIKSLGQGIGAVPGISGGAIMGDGRINLIIDVPGLLESAS